MKSNLALLSCAPLMHMHYVYHHHDNHHRHHDNDAVPWMYFNVENLLNTFQTREKV